MKKIFLLAAFMLVFGVYASAMAAYIPSNLRKAYGSFSSIPGTNADHTYYRQARYLLTSEIISGDDGTGNVRLDDNLSRAEIAKIVTRTISSDLWSNTDHGFSDVKDADWFSTYVETLKKKKIISGYEDGTFRPGASVTRGEAYSLFSRALDLTTAEAAERAAKESGEIWQNFYKKEMLKAGMLLPSISQKNDNEFITRGEAFHLAMAALISREMKTKKYQDTHTVSIPYFGIENLPAQHTAISDPAASLDSLTNVGAGFYYDAFRDLKVIWAHSSIWNFDPTPFGPVFEPLRDRGHELIGKTVLIDNQAYKVMNHRKVSESDISALEKSELDAILITCSEFEPDHAGSGYDRFITELVKVGE